MDDGVKFFYGILIATAIAGVCLSGVKSMQKTQNNVITGAEAKAQTYLQ